MKTIWYCYRLEEKRNKYDKPYFGKTKDLKSRAKRWQKKLGLDYIPELIVIKEDTSEQRIFDFEQERRVENGWSKESSLRHQRKIRKKGGKSVSKETHIKAGKIAGKIAVESGHLKNISHLGGKVAGKMAVESGHIHKIRTKESCSKGGKTQGNINVKNGNMYKAVLASAKKRTKITKEIIDKIKLEYQKKELNQYELADKYNISQSSINRIVRGQFINMLTGKTK